METIPITAERKAELEALARRQGKDLADLVDQALAAWLKWDRDDFEATIAAVNEGYADIEAGRSRPAAEALQDLRQSIQEGLGSGISDRTVGEIWADAEARFKGRNA